VNKKKQKKLFGSWAVLVSLSQAQPNKNFCAAFLKSGYFPTPR
jgi:hypothetical protein